MRIGSTFTNMMKLSSSSTLSSPPPSLSPPYLHRSPWHSPVPYLFGGLAAMLALIAFALLILACSYWKLSGYLETENEGQENENGGTELANKEENRVLEEKFLVIMAGEMKPTHIATPTPSTSRTSSFGSEKPATAGDGVDEVNIPVQNGSGDQDGTSTSTSDHGH